MCLTGDQAPGVEWGQSGIWGACERELTSPELPVEIHGHDMCGRLGMRRLFHYHAVWCRLRSEIVKYQAPRQRPDLL